MRLARLATVAAVCVTLALAAAGGANADPTKAPGAETITFVCDGVPIALTMVPGPGGSAAFTATTSVGIATGLVVTDIATGEELFNVQTPGFEKNALETVTCVLEVGGVRLTVTAFFTPARR